MVDNYKTGWVFKQIKNFAEKNVYTKKAFKIFDNEVGTHGLFNLEMHRVRFEGDKKLGLLIDKIVEKFQITSFIETGTFLGATASEMAKNHGDLTIYTCEINRNYHRIAREFLKKYKNIETENKNSKEFLAGLLKEKRISGVPLFFLDAHWYKFSPLKIEVELISSNIDKAIYLIHDFKVPNYPQFKYDVYDSASKNPINYDLALIEGQLNEKNNYAILFPKYNGDTGKQKYSGYVVIFQNQPVLFDEFMKDEFVKRNFFRGTLECDKS
ncbi:MAG: hypothetical protein ACTSRG_07180 [Candidatus Helarchaeota archaeon]